MAYRVLIVDDSPAMRNFVRRVLDLTGMEVSEYREASDGIEALDVLKGTWIDVILTDINMPRMNGEELVRCLEQDEVLRSVPVVVISTDATETRIHRLLKLGAAGYVKKPFQPETLRSELERVLRVVDAES